MLAVFHWYNSNLYKLIVLSISNLLWNCSDLPFIFFLFFSLSSLKPPSNDLQYTGIGRNRFRIWLVLREKNITFNCFLAVKFTFDCFNFVRQEKIICINFQRGWHKPALFEPYRIMINPCFSIFSLCWFDLLQCSHVRCFWHACSD